MDLEIDRSAPTERVQLDDASWVDVTRGFLREPEALLDRLLNDLTWKVAEQFRYEVTVTEPRMYADFGEPPPAVARQSTLHLESRYRKRFQGPGLLRYRHGHDSVGFHRDRSMRYLSDTLVAIAVLGEPRPFVLRPYGAGRDDRTPHDVDVAPGHGDLIVMGGRAQADWLHAVPKVPAATERVSLTWRWTSGTGPPDTSENYGAPRRFGQSARVGPQRRRRA